jgi:cobalt-zinc-cadmium efflux system membrane fusion protein
MKNTSTNREITMRNKTQIMLVATLAVGVAILATGCKDAGTTTSRGSAGAAQVEAPKPKVGDPAGSEAPGAPAGAERGSGARVGDPADWCGGHALPESMCTKCNPEIVEKFKSAGDWCEEHGYPESACPKCNPMAPPGKAAAPARVGDPSDWCGGHALPESMCTKCNPELVEKFKGTGDWCEEHGYPESACPKCNPMTPPGKAAAPARVGDPSDWCGGHALPESMCTKCNPELVPKFKAAGDWCEEHGYPESACPVCNPMSPPGGKKGAALDWCIEHGLPESKCTKCNRDLVAEYRDNGDWCAEHGFPESACPVCNPQAPPAGAEQAAIEARVVRLRTPDLEDAAGIRTTLAQGAEAAASVECTARIAFDADRVADVRALVPGVVRRVRAELGSAVDEGSPLFDLQSTHVGDVQATLQSARQRVRTARANLARQRDLRSSQIASAREVEVAEQELAAAKGEARAAEAALGMTGAPETGSSGRYTLVAPIAGTLVRRPAVVGVLATADTSLATVADTSVMWALFDVPETEASRVALGQRVEVTVDGARDGSFQGEITWISAEVDPRTRTVTARAEIANPSGLLRANQFGRARIETEAPRHAVAVPRDAVQRVMGKDVVFVRSARGTYQPRVVRRLSDGDSVQVEGGVKEGDAVVTAGAILLRTEVTPGSIGAGCCEVE